MTTLYLIRHGTTDSNLAGVFQGKLDTSLNERGMEQARLLAQRFAGVHLDRVYVSALQRARQTAQLLCGQTGAPCTILPALNEIDLGQLEGQSKSGWGQFPEAIRQFEKDVAHFQAPGGESTRQVYERMERAIDQIVGENPGGTVAVVSHGFTIQTYLNKAQGRPYEQMERCIVGNTAVSRFEYEGAGLPRVVYINDQSHLPEPLRFDLAEDQPG